MKLCMVIDLQKVYTPFVKVILFLRL